MIYEQPLSSVLADAQKELKDATYELEDIGLDMADLPKSVLMDTQFKELQDIYKVCRKVFTQGLRDQETAPDKGRAALIVSTQAWGAFYPAAKEARGFISRARARD